MSVTMTREEMLAALAEAARQVPDGDDGLTIKEITDALALPHPGRARETVRRLIQDGLMRAVKVRRTALDGRNALVSGYQFVTKA